MEKLVDVKQGVRVGIRPDEQYADETVWADGRNVVFSTGSVRPTLSQSYFIAQSTKVPITCLQEILIDGVKHLFWGSLDWLWHYEEGEEVYNSSDTVLAIPAGGYGMTRRQLWHSTKWKDTVIFTQGDATIGLPQFWNDVTNTFQYINFGAAGFTRAELVAVSKVHLLMLNTDADPTSIFWCDADDMTTWVAAATNSAGGLYIRSLKSPIIAVEPYQDVLGIYGTKSVYAVSYIGAPNYFTYNGPILEGIGAVGKHAVCAAGRKHYGMSNDGIWETDGFDYKYLDEGFIHKTIFDNMNADLIELVVAWHDVAEKMIVFFWPSTDSEELDSGIGYNYVTGAWTRLDFARTAVTSKHVFANALLGDARGNIWQQSEKGGIIAPPPIPGDPVSAPMEVLYNYENGYGGLSFGSGGYGYLWGFDNDGNVL